MSQSWMQVVLCLCFWSLFFLGQGWQGGDAVPSFRGVSSLNFNPPGLPAWPNILAVSIPCYCTAWPVWLCWKPPATRTAPGMSTELTSPGQKSGLAHADVQVSVCAEHNEPHPLLRHSGFPSPVIAVLYCWASTASYLTWGQFYFQELKSWKALEVLPPGQLCRSPWKNPPSPEAAKPRTVGQLLCHPTAQRAPGWALEQRPQALGRRTPRAKLRTSMELMKIHLGLLLWGKREKITSLGQLFTPPKAWTVQWSQLHTPVLLTLAGIRRMPEVFAWVTVTMSAPGWQVTAQALFDQVCNHLKHQGSAWCLLQECLSVGNLKASPQIIVL